jgi:hypothetical protein
MSKNSKTAKDDKKDNGSASPSVYDIGMFAKLSGIKSDQLYAFVQHATLEDLGEQTLDQWKKLLQDFADRPI